MATSPPVGLALSKHHVIGRLLGKGAFGSVHAVEGGRDENGQDINRWAVKLTPVPVKITKKQNTEIEIAYGRLWSENLMYDVQCRNILGTIVPTVPSQFQDGVKHYHDKLQGTRLENAVLRFEVF
jgi:hypothetical protein